MSVLPIRNPKDVHLALKSIEEEIGAFKTQLYNFISKPAGRKNAEQFICDNKHLIDSWDQQIVTIFLYSTTLPPFG